MALKNLLVHLDSTERSLRRLRVATAMASRHGAHFTGLYVKDLCVIQLNQEKAAELGRSPAKEWAAMRRLFDAVIEGGAEKARKRFENAASAAGVCDEWRCESGRADEIVPRHARYADLCIVGQWEPEMDDLPYLPRLVERVLFLSGRPVLIIPSANGPEELGRHILVGWNASRAAVRAVNDAMDVIAAAERITVLAVDPVCSPDAHGEEPCANIARHLAYHGAKVTVACVRGDTSSFGEVILDYAVKIGADMIVTGCYGHSRLRESILGGVTRTLLRQTAMPVLMSH